MIEALHFKDEKTDKFWFVETLVCEMMVNYGKTGTTGKYKIKEFDRNNRYYFDDEEQGLNRLIWNWDKEEATYYIETMRKDLIKYKENF
ncbi:WGR domain-containing protein [Fusobacterium polymorphum]|uniref:WGR domain-containing protein n=1 Tax=Fusobacterium nucleatum subsp. polymorphum TaxID=76857 RepID=UPI002B4C0C5A|nr:WGR domain-containing protein [Fusobacterium polymorphum]WRL70768.1 WGR domain-containing protein [Fusobacterium polymorphum]